MIFISDLHLGVADGERIGQFLHFFEQVAVRQGPLFILGDLFEFWAGPAQARLASMRTLLRTLHEGMRRGLEVYFLGGNRDFLFEWYFVKRLDGKVLKDGAQIEMEGTRIKLMHGDSLCTDDLHYQQMKRWLRSPLVQCGSRCLPSCLCLSIGRRFRRISQRAMAKKDQRQLEFNTAAVKAALRQGADLIICGHLHRWGIREYEVDNRLCHVYVLGAEPGRIEYLLWENHGLQRRFFI